MADTVVGGLGNTLMSDEGVGVLIVRRLAQLPAGRFPGVEFVELGTSAMQAVHAMAGRRKAVFVDCAFMDREPGALVRFGPDEVRTRKELPRLSLHEGDLLQGIELSRRLGECPEEVVIFGVEPASIEFGECLSPALQARLDSYVEAVAAEVQ